MITHRFSIVRNSSTPSHDKYIFVIHKLFNEFGEKKAKKWNNAKTNCSALEYGFVLACGYSKVSQTPYENSKL